MQACSSCWSAVHHCPPQQSGFLLSNHSFFWLCCGSFSCQAADPHRSSQQRRSLLSFCSCSWSYCTEMEKVRIQRPSCSSLANLKLSLCTCHGGYRAVLELQERATLSQREERGELSTSAWLESGFVLGFSRAKFVLLPIEEQPKNCAQDRMYPRWCMTLLVAFAG